METKEKVLEVMKAEGRPLTAGEVADLSGLERKVVDKTFNQLKKEDKIESPIRCKWQPKE
ncbi:MAG TPA: Rrf2 family transcriptional regulator [Acholeplasmataceae bacterium]|jgi:DNA-binding IscR family transcriptional regulator|nr:Rrf2 family transcriptional regulator [Acholeplasmataceae bacterium]